MEPWGIKKMSRVITFLDKLQRKASIRVKVIIGVSLILTIMASFTYYDMVTRLTARTEFQIKQQEKRAFEISDTVMRSIEYPMLDGEMENVQAILERLKILKDVSLANLSDTTGTIKYSGLPANIDRIDDSESAKKTLRSRSISKGLETVGGEKVFFYALPIHNERICHKCHGAEKEILGTLSVGISWTAIEENLAELRNREIILTVTWLAIAGIFLNLFLSRYITQPLTILARLADDISHGKSGFNFGRTFKCWEIKKCDKNDCPAHGNTDIMCWYLDGTHCKFQQSGRFPEKFDMCRKCEVYKSQAGDEIIRLTDSFKHMLYILKASQKELKQSEEKYKLLFDTDPNPIFILDRKTLAILDANARAESQYGYSKKDFLKMFLFDLGYEDDAQEIISSFEGVFDGCIFFDKKRYRKKDGVLFYATIHVCNARYMGKDALIATTTDVTESVRKDAQLVQTSKMATLGEMATGVAHELNQPLNTIQIGTDFFRNMVRQGREIPADELALVSEQMAGQVSRAVNIINHLREFGCQTEIQKEEVDINKPLKGVFTLLSQQLQLRGINVVLDLQEDLPHIMVDSNRLEQVFMNLVINARQAMEEKNKQSAGTAPDNTLTVRSFQENGRVVATVTDTGPGIPANIREKIFEPFFTTKKVDEGTGLGLSINYGIVKDYNGTIEVESVAGKGSTFKITLPACKQEKKGA